MRILTVICIVCCAWVAKAQMDPLYSQYMQNKAAYNPAATGSYDGLNTTLVFRSQWAKIEGAPTTLSLTVDNSSKSDKHGYGGSLMRDSYGPVSEYALFGMYAYKLKLGQKGHLGFGLQAGIQLFTANASDLTAVQAGDNAYEDLGKTDVVGNAGVGIYYYNDKLTAGISAPRLFNNKIYTNSDNFLANHYYAHFDYKFKVVESILSLQPGMLLKYSAGANAQLDISLNLIIMKDVLVGFAYRTDKSAVFMAQYQLNLKRSQFRIGYSYDLANGQYRSGSSGAHEVLVGFLLKKKEVATDPSTETQY